ncbi:DNA repair protein RAD51 homolog 4 isoform X1 [Rutidosis leptorrhynchoides]|uniref:DNA repair protein RAD51 homolog 4 isoform X1 n=1 Tax=Rutidosis leptorrhynchoides TaxID=125765 RepID=UPI003A99A661
MGTLKSLKEIDVNFQQFCASHGILSIEDFLIHDVKSLVESAEKLSNSDQLKQGVNQLMCILETHHQPWMNGLALLEDRQQKKHYLSTGFESFDVLLQGGLREGHVTELVGPSSSGKTQVCFQVASNVAMKLGSVVFFDSGNSFSPTRIKQIATCVSGSAENQVLQQTLRNIQCHAVFDIYALMNILQQLKLNLKSQTGYQVRLLIVDSISSLIAPVLGGSNSQGYVLMVSVGYLLKELADRHNIAVLVTNHMVSGEGGNLKPALGESWKNIPHVRLQLSWDHASTSCVRILRHPHIASGTSANFMIP